MNTEQKELWDSYDGKGFAAQYSQYSERARTDADEHDITLTISNDTVTLIGGKAITAASATSATSATQDASGNVITDTYATKSELPGTMTGASQQAAGSSGLVPAPAAGDEEKLLTGDGNWTPLENDVFGTQLLDENDQPILDETQTPPTIMYDAGAATNLWTGFAGKGFGAIRAYADQDGNNIKTTYATKSALDGVTTGLEDALDTLNDAMESVAHAGMYDLGAKTESDLTNGKLAIGCGNSNTELTLTTVNALTVLANPGVANFALLVDNTGNSNDVTVTVKNSADTTTFYQSTAAGNTVSAGKICQLTCVGRCWTLAEFELPGA